MPSLREGHLAKMRIANALLTRGGVALSQVSRNGIRVDTGRAKEVMDQLDVEVEELSATLTTFDEWKVLKKKFGKPNADSTEQIRFLIYEHYKVPRSKLTATGLGSVDAEVLKDMDRFPFVDTLLRKRKLSKIKNTYLTGILREVSDDQRVHPFFNLQSVQTFRSSSSDPNFQNMPIRDPELSKYVRDLFFPSGDKWALCEWDYAKLEVCFSACYNKDPALIREINDPDQDMHGDSAALIYKLPRSKVSKQARYSAKNGFVFPAFYGSYYVQTANDLWKNIQKLSLEHDGVSLYDHLKKHGIHDYEDFEEHIRSVEDWLWNERFPVYTAWKKKWYDQYLKRGWFQTKTGFICQGFMRRNQVINYPIQGSAFHCLLFSLILFQEFLNSKSLRTKVVGQIHDSILLDLYLPEKDIVFAKLYEIMVGVVPYRWPWIIVPLSVEPEMAPPGAPWSEKKEVEYEFGFNAKAEAAKRDRRQRRSRKNVSLFSRAW